MEVIVGIRPVDREGLRSVITGCVVNADENLAAIRGGADINVAVGIIGTVKSNVLINFGSSAIHKINVRIQRWRTKHNAQKIDACTPVGSFNRNTLSRS